MNCLTPAIHPVSQIVWVEASQLRSRTWELEILSSTADGLPSMYISLRGIYVPS